MAATATSSDPPVSVSAEAKPSPSSSSSSAQQDPAISSLTTPLASTHLNDTDSELIASLHALSAKSPKLVRSSEYRVPLASGSTKEGGEREREVVVRSWKMNEFKYYDVPSPFPTLARGLFTQEVKGEGTTRYRIVARGYDKFFNIGEVPWTTWQALEENTTAPYTLTLKSNGCIIFIAALTPAQLLVTSKHSLGPAPGASGAESHAQVGERWLRTHLARAGKTEAELARTLWERNWTAVAELCDDSFEEHVLPYGPAQTGLHLHGLNACTRIFSTEPQAVVDAFAAEWGFIATASTELATVAEVKAFTEEVGRTGAWRGEPLEGFVVRTRAANVPTRGTRAQEKRGAAPYAAGGSFFFKVKFDEPYLMYRDWREATKALLCKGADPGNVPRGKMRRRETRLYVGWVCREIARDPAQFAEFTKGKGIIATRERFLRWLESDEGKRALEEEGHVPGAGGAADGKAEKGRKTVVMPIAIPGCGKTTVGVALAHLFGFAHVQSDDIAQKKAAPIFLRNVENALKAHDVVIADKNNHLQQHRTQLRDVAAKFTPPARLLALPWPLDAPEATVHRICGARVLARGAAHQSLVPSSDGSSSSSTSAYEDVLWMFLRHARHELFREAEADAVVHMELEESLEDAVARAARGVCEVLGLEKPSVEKVGEALAAARAYHPKVTAAGKAKAKAGAGADAKAEKGGGKSKAKANANGNGDGEGKKKAKPPPAPRYYAVLAEFNPSPIVLTALASASSLSPAARRAAETLAAGKHVKARPHITLAHGKGLAEPGAQAVWDRCVPLCAYQEPRPTWTFRAGSVVWNERVMALAVEDLRVVDEDGSGDGDDAISEARALAEVVRAQMADRLHVTVGTSSADVPPMEAGLLVRAWRRGEVMEGQGVWTLPLEGVWVKGQLKGMVH